MVENYTYEKFRDAMRDETNYKEGSKFFKRRVQSKESEGIVLLIEYVQRTIVQKHREKPVTQLNALRIIKECFEYFVPEYMDTVEERILPLLSQIAHFNQGNKSTNRGQLYFVQGSTNAETQDQQERERTEIIGNSFFHLVLECLYVWATWLPNTQFGETYRHLISQNITFPEKLTYFKPELLNSIDVIKQQRKEQAEQRKLNSQNLQGSSNLQGSNLNFQFVQNQESSNSPSKPQTSNQQEPNFRQEPVSSVRLEKSEVKLDENPFVQVNRAISEVQQMRQTLMEGLGKPKPLEPQLLDYLRQKFEDFKSHSKEYSTKLLARNEQLDGYENLFGSLFNEGEFAEKFLTHCAEYNAKSITWTQFQNHFADYMKKPKLGGDVSQTIGEYVSIRMQSNMLASDFNNINNATIPRQFNLGPSKHDDEEADETTIPANSDFHRHSEQPHPSIPQQFNGDIHANHKELQQNYHHNNGENHNNLTQQRRDEYNNLDTGRRTLRDAINDSETGADRYKFELKSKTNFIRHQTNMSNVSQTSHQQARPIISKNYNSNGNNIASTQQALEKVLQERDHYKQLYEEQQEEILRLEAEISKARQMQS